MSNMLSCANVRHRCIKDKTLVLHWIYFFALQVFNEAPEAASHSLHTDNLPSVFLVTHLSVVLVFLVLLFAPQAEQFLQQSFLAVMSYASPLSNLIWSCVQHSQHFRFCAPYLPHTKAACNMSNVSAGKSKKSSSAPSGCSVKNPGPRAPTRSGRSI